MRDILISFCKNKKLVSASLESIPPRGPQYPKTTDLISSEERPEMADDETLEIPVS